MMSTILTYLTLETVDMEILKREAHYYGTALRIHSLTSDSSMYLDTELHGLSADGILLMKVFPASGEFQISPKSKFATQQKLKSMDKELT